MLGTWAAELTPSSLRDAVSVPREGVEQVAMEYWVTLHSAQMMGFGIDTCLTQGLSLKVTENFLADFRTWISKDMERCSQSVSWQFRSVAREVIWQRGGKEQILREKHD